MVQRGRQPSVVATPDTLRAAAASQGGDATMAPLGLTFGRMVDGAAAGKHAAEYRKISGTALATYNVPHGLGFVPAWAILVHYVNPGNPATHMNMAPFEYDKWKIGRAHV